MGQIRIMLGLLLLTACSESSLQLPAARAGGLAAGRLNVMSAPSDDGMLLSWISPPGSPRIVVRWHASDSSGWNERSIGARNHAFIADLPPGVPHQFIVTALIGEDLVAIDTLQATPRTRQDCLHTYYIGFEGYFCSRVQADIWMRSQGVAPTDLRCRNQPVTDWGPDAADCLYTAGGNFSMLLLRGADTVLNSPEHPPTVAETRAALRLAIWPQGDPFSAPDAIRPTIVPVPLVGAVRNYTFAATYLFDPGGVTKTRATRFMPRVPVAGHYAIYHEGHGESGTEMGADMIEFLLERGWEVYATDMPFYGPNVVDKVPGDTGHFDLPKHDDGTTSILALFALPVKRVVDYIEATRPTPTALVIVGRSGGGLMAYIYGALDPRVTAVVSVAGGRPMSERLKSPFGASEIGDPEQSAPEIFAGLRHEDLMVAAGGRGALLMFSTWDPCCMRVAAGDPFIDYLERGGTRTGRMVRTFVDPVNATHGLGPSGFTALDLFLRDVTR